MKRMLRVGRHCLGLCFFGLGFSCSDDAGDSGGGDSDDGGARSGSSGTAGGGTANVGGTASGGKGGSGTSGDAGDAGSAGSDAGASGSGGNPVFDPGPSCDGLEARCGPDAENCCVSIVVPGGSFDRANDDAYPATVSDFRLDKYEVTVGRFRKFVDAYPGSRPDEGAGTNPNNPSDPGFTAVPALPDDRAGLLADATCGDGDPTWTDTPGDNESLPINCLRWSIAYAFCIWDGGRLPTEAEWNYAAAGGGEQRPYPWSSSPTDLTISATYANYNTTADSSALDVGSKSPLGDSRWGHSDLAGNLREFVQDTSNTYTVPCVDCRSQGGSTVAIVRGGGFYDPAGELLTSARNSTTLAGENYGFGMRCARSP